MTTGIHLNHSPPSHSPEETITHQMQCLRLKASELLIREQWQESILAYSKFIELCEARISPPKIGYEECDYSKIRKSLCLALSNRAEARCRLREFDDALTDCDRSLGIEGTHFKSLICKGRILLNLNKYSDALSCFKLALLQPQSGGNVETLNEYAEKCKRLEYQSRTGVFDLSDWVVNGFRGKTPDLAEYIGALEIKKSKLSGRGLFATKDIEAGTFMLVTKAIAIERGILFGEETSEVEARLVMWKNFVGKIVDCAKKSKRVHLQVLSLSNAEEEHLLDVPDISIFKHDFEGGRTFNETIDQSRIVSILNVNSLVEDTVSSKVLGKNSNYYGVGLWLLPSFINHSCNPNSRRLHVGDQAAVLASRDIKAGEEITFAYFDVLSPFHRRAEEANSWGFSCRCSRCEFEKDLFSKQEVESMRTAAERGPVYAGGAISRMEEKMRAKSISAKEKGYVRASFWEAYSKMFESETQQLSRKLPSVETAASSVIDATGSDERVVAALVKRLRKNGETEKAIKAGRGVYGRALKKQAMKTLLRL